MLVGTYTDGGSKGIYSFRFNQESGEAEALNSLALKNPSYLTVSRDGRLVYAVSETNDDKASLNTIRLNPKTGDMQLLTSAAVMGGDPCYVATNGETVLTANYSGGSMSVFSLNQQGFRRHNDASVPEHPGTKPELSTRFLGTTGGPDMTRQNTPHVHCACFTPDGKYALATDFSADRILSYRLIGQKVVAWRCGCHCQCGVRAASSGVWQGWTLRLPDE